MKFFTLPALLAAALFAAVVSVPFLPAAKIRPDVFVLEVRASSTVNGAFQVYYDDGAGWREELSGRSTISASATPLTYRLSLPPGRYKALRVDPLDRGGSVTVTGMRVLSPANHVLHKIPLDGLQPVQQIQSAVLREGALEITTAPGSDDAQLEKRFSSPLVVDASWRDYVRGSLPFVLPVFAGLAALLFLLDRAPRLRDGIVEGVRNLAARPARAVSVVAAFAVIASTYPVVFLGKSHVSPNLGTTLLYDTYPTLPGYKSAETIDVKGSDIGAVMWSHIPLSMVQHRALAQGELPLWNRYNSLGTPMLAQGQSMFGDPLHLFVIACNGASWAWDIKYVVAKWLFATGLGLIVLAVAGPQSRGARIDDPGSPARKPQETPSKPEHTLPAAHAAGCDSDITPQPILQNKTTWMPALGAALIVAFAAPFYGFFYYRLNHPAYFSVCYAPWALYCWIRVTHAATRRGVALWGAGLIIANVALMNSGTAKEAYMLLLTLNFSGACVLLASATSWRERAAKFTALSWAGVIFVLLTAPVWATFLTTLGRAYTGYNAASAFQVQPAMLLGAFDELFYRPMMAEQRTFDPSVNFVILLGLLYFLATLRVSFGNRTVMALAASSLLPLSLAFGLISPEWIVRIPFLANVAHLDNTFTCALLVLWSALAGVGFVHAAQRLSTREGRGDLLIAGLLLFALVFAWVGFRQASHRPIFGPNQTFSPLLPGQTLYAAPFVTGQLVLMLSSFAILAFVVRGGLIRRRITPGAGIIIGLCAIILVWRTGLHASAVGFENYVARPTVRTNFHARSAAIEFVRQRQHAEPSRSFGFKNNFFPGWTGVYGLEGIHGPDALVNPFVRELVGDLPGVTRIWDWRLYGEPKDAGVARRFLDVLNVRHYFDLQSDQGLLGKALSIAKIADLDVYESPTAWPRAFFSDRVDVYDEPADFVRKIQGGDGRPFAAAQRKVVSIAPALAALPHDLVDRAIIPAKDYVLTENTTSFNIRATGPGVVVLNEAFWPGDFHAEINGQKTPVVRLNHAFNGIVIGKPGDYAVTFRYWPKNFTRNLVLCGFGALLLAGSLWLALRPVRIRHRKWI